MKIKNLIIVISLSLFTIWFSACCNDTSLIGSWEEPIPSQKIIIQGFNLKEGGVASSINMSTLVYNSWQQDGELLILSGKSIGNGQTLNFIDTLKINKLTRDSLVVQRKNMIIRYCKKKVSNK